MPTQPQTVTIAQARASTASGLVVVDTGANIVAALPNTALTNRITSFTVLGVTTLTAAQMSLLFPITAKLHAATGALLLSGVNSFSVAQLSQYAALPGFALSPTGSSVTLSDTTAQVVALLMAHPAYVGAVTTVNVQLDGTSIGAYPASLLNNLAVHGKTLVFVPTAGHTSLNIAATAHDLATNAAALNMLGTHTPLTFAVNNDGTAISAADAASLVTITGFLPSAHTLTIADTGANVSAHLSALLGHGYSQILVTSGTLSGTPAQLLDSTVHLASGAHAQLASSATVTAAVAASLAGLSGYTTVSGATLTVADTAANLVATSASWLAVAGSAALAADATISGAAASTLAQIAGQLTGGLSLAGHSLTVADTLPTLIGLSSQATGLATALALTADATVSATQFVAFASLSGASLNGHHITVADSATDLLALPSGSLGLASAIELSADTTLSAAAAQALIARPGYTADGSALTVADTASVLAALTGPVLAFAVAEQVSVSATISAATATALASLPHETQATGVVLTLQDSMANLLALGTPALSVAGVVQLIPGSTTSTDAAHAALLAVLPGFSASGATITVTDTIANLNAPTTAAWSSVAATHAVVDSASAIAAAAGSSVLSSASSVALSAPASVSAAAAATLAGIPNFTGIGQLTVSDSTAALIAHASALIGLGRPVTVTDSATISVAGAVTLAQIAAAAGIGFSFGGHSLTIADSAAALLGLSNAQAALGSTLALNADATLTAAQFTEFSALPNISLGGHVLTVADTAINLLSLPSGSLGLASAIELSADTTLSAFAAQALTSRSGYIADSHLLTVSDTATALAGLTGPLLTFAAAEQVSVSATIGAATATALANLPHATEASGVVLTVQDSMANLLALGAPALVLLGATRLIPGSTTTTDAAHAASLAALPGFSANAATLVVSDTLANLNAAGTAAWSTVATTHAVVDSAASIIAGAASPVLVSASSVALSAPATVNAAGASTLAGLSNFVSTAQLTVADTTSALIAVSALLISLARPVVVTDSATVSAANAATLAQIAVASGNGFSFGGHSLTIADSAGALLGLTGPQAALAAIIALDSNATLSAAQYTALHALPHISTGGYVVTIADTATNLLALPSGSLNLASVIELSANATLSVTATQALTSRPGYTADSSTLTIADTASVLASLTGPVLTFAVAEQVSISATISAATATALANLPHETEASGVTLTLQDSMANLLALGAPAQAVANAIRLIPGSTTATDVAHAALLAALPGFSASGATITVTDTVANLSAPATSGWANVASSHGVIDSAAAIVAAAGSPVLTSAASVALPGPATIGAAAATTLASLSNFVSVAQLSIADTTASLIANGAALIGLARPVTVTDSATVSVAGAATLAQIAAAAGAGFSLGGHSLTIADSATSLLGLTTPQAALAATIALNADATVTSAQFSAFRALPNVSLAGHVLTVSDTATNLAALGGDLSLIGVSALSGDTIVTAARLAVLVALPGFSAGGHVLTLADTATNLLGLPSGAFGQVAATILSANATITALQAQILFADPSFSTAGHTVIVADTAANLLALSPTLQVAASLLALSGNQTVSASVLTQLAALGIKFSEAGHALIALDTAANLITLSPAALALASVQVLSASAIVSAATAASLAALPNFALAHGISLAIQDSVANLIALGQGAPTVVTSETLVPGSMVSVSAQQATALAGLPHFSPTGATITITDTVANLTAASGTVLQTIGTSIAVVDTASILAANAGTSLVQTAAAVSLSGNAQVSSAAATQIATIPHFSDGAYQLAVADTAANIAMHASAILQVATSAIVTDSGPVSIATADQLATVATAGILSFQGGNQLLVQDSFANLTSNANSAGFALAARVGVVDTAANLATASAHNWGALNPNYTLSQGGTVAGAVATTLAALGSHYSSGGYTISVADTAASVSAAAAAISTLEITAVVTDTAANIGAQASGLAGLGNALTAIYISDGTSVLASVAAGLSTLTSKLAGPALQVSDTAAHVDAALAGLSALGAHVAITVSDSAADVGAYATDLATLGSHVTVAFTDNAAVTAGVAAALLPILAEVASGTTLGVTDIAANVVSHAATLATLSSVIGTITLSDGNTLSAANAAALAPLDGHLPVGVMLTATGTAAAITANEAGLLTLNADDRLAAVNVAGTTVADVSANVSALNALSAHVTVSDTAADVDSGLASLAQVTGLSTIALTDGGRPALSMTLATLATDTATLTKITTPYSVSIFDTASHIAADLGLGSNSVIFSHLSQISQISPNDAQPLVLSQALLLAPGMDDGPNSALAKFTGTLNATGVDVAHLGQIEALNHAPNAVSVNDSSANIATDLALGNGSTLIAALPNLTAVNVSSGQHVLLTATQALAAGVDDAAHSVIGLLQGADLIVTQATIANLSALAALHTVPTAISVNDNGANIAADLASGSSALIAGLPGIVAVNDSNGANIVLSEQQVLATHVDDGTGSVLAKTTNISLEITNVAAADLTEVLNLGVAPNEVVISDSGVDVVANLGAIISGLGSIASIQINGAPLTLTAAQALSAHVDDGVNSVVADLATNVFDVTGASVAQLSMLSMLPTAPYSIGVTDSSSHIAADLLANGSALVANIGLLGTITVTGGTLSLTDAQATTILGGGPVAAAFTHLASGTVVAVTGVPVADISTLATGFSPNVMISVADTATAIGADLAGNASIILSAGSVIGSVTLTTGGTVAAAALSAMSSLPNFSTGGFALHLQDTAAAILALGTTPLALAHDVLVQDTAADVASTLNALQTKFVGALAITLTDGSPSISVTAAQYAADHATIDAVTNSAVFTVTGSADALSTLAANLASDASVSNVTVTDSAVNVISDLDMLQLTGTKLHISLTDSSIAASLVSPLLGISNLSPSGLPVVDTGTQIAAVAESGDAPSLSYLNTYGATLSGDSSVGAADAAALEGLSNFHKGGHNLVVWDTAQHLTIPAYASALSNGLIDGVYLKTAGGTVTVTAATAAMLFAITGFSTTNPSGTTNTFIVSDTAAHIDANLAALATNSAHISSIIVNASATITDQTLSDLQGLSAVPAAGVLLTVHDTAATIAANAAAQATGHTILPAAWALSANATVSEATAATLGGISTFNPGPYTITLTLGSDTPVSITDANKLGTIAGSLNLGGYRLLASGSVAQLSTLSNTALNIVTPAIIDSFAHVAALPLSSPLLLGTVEVTGNDQVSISTATALLSLVHTGSGPGISSSALTFDSLHDIYDSVANLRGFTTGSAWTGSASAHASFRLAAQDSVANLVNPANTAFLSGLSVSTLPSDVSISAGTASSLAGLVSSIHFNRGTFHITVQDGAANLLSTGNAAGVALADSVQLSGPSQVDAADAETLLGLTHFHLNTTLTISDSSANLLDGVLSNAITNSGFGPDIQVQLAGPETLDVQTAESLVSIPGFADTHNLTISDDPSYLLDTANLPAEQMAAQVTLPSDETVSAHTVLRLSQIPHFTPGSSHLVLAGNDFADGPTLAAIADIGAAFESNGYTIRMTASALHLTPVEYTALQSDNILQNGHLLGVLPTGVALADSGNLLTITGLGTTGGTVHIYGGDGTLISSNLHAAGGFTVMAADTGPGHNFTLAETANGQTNDGAPLVILDTGALETAVATAGGSFASSGAIQVDSGKFVDLYQGSAPGGLTHAVLVYNSVAHTIALDVPGNAPVTLVTLGGSTHPAVLDATEILLKIHG